MEIKLLNLKLRNFKGASNQVNACKSGKELDLTFGDITIISGDNASLKSTCFDAFMWLLFDKNSNDDKVFNIKTLRPDNTPIHKLEHEVSGTLDVDGRHIPLKKIYTEKWAKKKGEATVDAPTGHETEYFIHDVPMKKGDYEKQIDMILQESLAKLITNPLYFNQMKWQDQRKALEDMAGAITNEFIAGSNEDFKALVARLGTTSLEDEKKKINAAKKKIKDALDVIPTRMDEVDRGKPKIDDYENIEKEIAVKNGELEGIDKQIEGNVQQHEVELGKIREKQTDLSNLKTKLQQADVLNKYSKATKLTEITGQIGKLNADIDSAKGLIRGLESQIKQADSTITLNNTNIQKNQDGINTFTEDNEKLVNQWSEENEKELTIDVNALKCPTCKQDLPETERATKTETLTANFNKAKATELTRIKNQGLQLKSTIENLQAQNSTLAAENEQLEIAKVGYREEIAKFKNGILEFETLIVQANEMKAKVETEEVPPTIEMTAMKMEIEAFIIPPAPEINNEVLKQQKATINAEIQVLKERLDSRQQIAKAEKRIFELGEEEKNLSQKKADLERDEFTIEAFSRAKIETIQARINGKFKLVKWKLFQQNINGGVEECCEAMVNGVPYSDINTGAQINAGIDIINAFTEHYHINAPIWIDNRESTTTILPCKSQIINLVALKGKPLEIRTQETNDLTLTLN